MIQAFPAREEEQVYVMTDSWFTSRKLVDTCNVKGFHVISAVKSNRNIRPNGIKVSMSHFADQYIQNPDLRSVTVKGKGKFRIYEYEGPVSDIENAKVLLSWKKSSLRIRNRFAFSVRISLWMSSPSWSITMYAGKSRRDTAISRNFWASTSISCFLSMRLNVIGPFNTWYRTSLSFKGLNGRKPSLSHWVIPLEEIRSEMLGQLVVYAYQEGMASTPLKMVLKTLKLIA